MRAAKTVGRWLKRILGYGLVFWAAFGVTLYYSFPYEVIGDRLLGEAEARFGAKVEVGALSPYWITGLSAETVTITFPAKRAGKDDLILPFDRVSARLKPLDSLLGAPTVAIILEANAGEISGDVSLLEDERINAILQVQRLTLGDLGGVWDKLGLGFAGTVTGDLNLTLPQTQPTALDGTANLQVAEAKFGGGMIKGFTVPGMDLGTFALELAAEKGKLEFAPPLEVKGKDLAAFISGTIDLRPVMSTSRGNLALRFKPTDAFWKDNATLAGIAKAMLEGSKDSEGYYAYDLTGPLGRPGFSPHRKGRGR